MQRFSRPDRLRTGEWRKPYASGMVSRIGQRRRVHYYLREWRDSRNWTLKQLGDLVGVGENTIWRWENEQHRLNAEKLAQLAEVFGFKDGDSFTRPPTDRPSLDTILKDAPPDAFEDVLRLARRVAGKPS